MYVPMRSRDERNKGIRSQRRGGGGFSTRTLHAPIGKGQQKAVGTDECVLQVVRCLRCFDATLGRDSS